MIHIIDSIKLLFRKDKELFSALYDILGFYPRNITLYRMALSHRSMGIRDKNGQTVNNERLEFLGDAIIEAVVSDIVFRHFTHKSEGFLTTTRSKLVQRETLNKLAADLGLDRLIKAAGHLGGHNQYLGGNAFEALVGAIYLDRGYSTAFEFLKKRILTRHINIDKVAKKEVNFKSKLLEWSQHNRIRIEFQLADTDHADSDSPVFTTLIEVEGTAAGKGTGYSKKESHQNAARETLQMLSDKRFIDRILAAKEKRTAMEAELVSTPPKVEPENEQGLRTAPRVSRRSRRAAQEAAAKEEKVKNTNETKAENAPRPVTEKQGKEEQPAAKETVPSPQPVAEKREEAEKPVTAQTAPKPQPVAKEPTAEEEEPKEVKETARHKARPRRRPRAAKETLENEEKETAAPQKDKTAKSPADPTAENEGKPKRRSRRSAPRRRGKAQGTAPDAPDAKQDREAIVRAAEEAAFKAHAEQSGEA